MCVHHSAHCFGNCALTGWRFWSDNAPFSGSSTGAVDGDTKCNKLSALGVALPTISHLCRFWTKAFVKMPKKTAKSHIKKHPEHAGETAYRGRFIGYHHWDTKTKTVLVGDGNIVNSIDVELDYRDYRSTAAVENDFTYAAPKHQAVAEHCQKCSENLTCILRSFILRVHSELVF